MKLSSILLFTFLTFTVYAQENLFFKTRLQIFAEVGDFGAGFTADEKGKGLSVAVVKPFDKHIELTIRGGLRQAASKDPLEEDPWNKYYNIATFEIIENSITNFHLGAQLGYAYYFKNKNALKVKIGASYSFSRRITFSQTLILTEGNKDYLIYGQYHNKNNFIDYTGNIEYERKLSERLSGGFEFGVAYKEGFPFGSLIFGVIL